MRKLSAQLFLIPVFLVSTPIVLAETNTTPRPTKNEIRQNEAQTKASTSADLREKRQEALEEFKTKRQEALEEFKGKKAQIEAEFKAKLAKIKDSTKQEIAQRIEDNLNNINQRHTEAFANRLDKFNDFLDRITSRKDKAKSNGKDVTKVETAISAAQTAIAAAQTAVATQSGKTYTINFTNETDLKTAANTVRLQLRADLKATHDKVAAARKAIVDALQALAAVRGVDDDTASGSANLTQ